MNNDENKKIHYLKTPQSLSSEALTKLRHFLKLTRGSFRSDSYRTPEYLSWHKAFIKTFTALLSDFYADEVIFSKPNHFDGSGFFRRGECWHYFCIPDIRAAMPDLYLRSAKDPRDYCGGRNRFISLENTTDFFEQFRTAVESNERPLFLAAASDGIPGLPGFEQPFNLLTEGQ